MTTIADPTTLPAATTGSLPEATDRRHEHTYSQLSNAFAKAADVFLIESKRMKWRNDPVMWANDRIGMRLWSKQQEIAYAVRDNKKTAVKSCHGIGKSQLAAVLICWWIDTHPLDEVYVVTTAPTSYQVNKILWEYIRKLHRENNLLGTVSEANEWKDDNRDVRAVGRKPADHNDHGFQGIHRRYVLAVLDESGGIPESLWTGVEAITTGSQNRILAIGNPDDPATEFGRIFREDPDWAKFTVSAFDTPNFTGEVEDFPELAELLVSKQWVEEKAKSWGVTSGRYRSKVLGEFPLTSKETLFPPHLLQAVCGRQATDDKLDPSADIRPIMGVDVARYGDDLSTAILNHGGVLTVLDSWEKLSTRESAARIHKLAVDWAVSEVRVDATGIGAGVVDSLIEVMGNHYQVFEMVGSAASPDVRRWINARAWWHDNFLNLLRDRLISLPAYIHLGAGSKERTFYEELEGIKYKWHKGALQIESKDEMKKNGGKSPDFSDAAMYATAPLDDNGLLSRFDPGDLVGFDALEMGFEDWMDQSISPF